MKNSQTRDLAMGGLIAALYVVLTFLAQALGLASGAIQVRISESLCLLPCLMPGAVPGLAVGCVLANLLTGCAPWDVVFGSLATLIGAVGTRLMRKKPMLSWIPPVLSNTLIVPLVLMRVYGVGAEGVMPWLASLPGGLYLPLAIQIFIGEMISVVLLGIPVLKAVERGLKTPAMS
jgi:uncharacterized membrane protein